MSDKPDLKPISGGRPDKPRAGRRRSLDESEQIYCHRCLATRGVETSAVVAIVLAPRRTPSGKMIGGTKIMACAHCHAEGAIVDLIRK